MDQPYHLGRPMLLPADDCPWLNRPVGVSSALITRMDYVDGSVTCCHLTFDAHNMCKRTNNVRLDCHINPPMMCPNHKHGNTSSFSLFLQNYSFYAASPSLPSICSIARAKHNVSIIWHRACRRQYACHSWNNVNGSRWNGGWGRDWSRGFLDEELMEWRWMMQQQTKNPTKCPFI